MTEQKRILVVDDDPDLVDSVSMKLESENFIVAKAYDGNEAWDQIKAQRPDLIVLDVMMPNKDGYTVCKELKTIRRIRTSLLYWLTGVGDQVTETTYTHQDGKTTLANDFVPKPIDLDKLMEIVKDNLA